MQTAVQSIVSFVTAVTDRSDNEVRPYIDEIVANREFHNSIKAKQRTPSGERLPRASVNSDVGSILYAICRQLKPESVVETGVAAGMSSSHFLCALDENRFGQLFSIDFPTWEPDTGWTVPDDLKSRWTLLSGRSSEKLPGLLERLEKDTGLLSRRRAYVREHALGIRDRLVPPDPGRDSTLPQY